MLAFRMDERSNTASTGMEQLIGDKPCGMDSLLFSGGIIKFFPLFLPPNFYQ
jgi:hypothetical protein